MFGYRKNIYYIYTVKSCTNLADIFTLFMVTDFSFFFLFFLQNKERLRIRNPSPYMFVINLGLGEHLVGASP